MRTSAKSIRSVFILLVLCAIDVPAQAQLLPQPAPRYDKLDPIVLRATADPAGRSQVIVRAQDSSSVDAVTALIVSVGGMVGRALPLLDARVAAVSNATLLVLADSPLVRRIASDRLIGGTMERTGATIGATIARQTFGYDGTGIGVAVIDSGVTAWHDDLSDRGSGTTRLAGFIDFVNGRQGPYDDYGHGTHVSGIIGGNGFDSGGARAGIAPGVHLLALKVLDASGRGRISDVIAAFDYVIAHKNALSLRIINVSIGAGVYESYNQDLLTLAARRAVEAGLVVVAAAGNMGRYNERTVYGGITAPGNAPWVLTVGASSHNGTTDRTDDSMTSFSSRGPTAVDYSAKPDLVAPGLGIESLSDRDSAMYSSMLAYLLAGTIIREYLPYLSLSGTSQAASVVSGTAALMLQANPALTPNAVKAILQYSAQQYPGYDSLTQGAGFLNAYGAIELARCLASSSACPSSAGTRQIIWGNHRLTGGDLRLDANAWSPLVVWGAARQDGNPIVWGSIPPPGAPPDSTERTAWGTSCLDAACSSVSWGSEPSENVVWGSRCGGADCRGGSGDGGASATSVDDTVVWGTSDSDTVVWGTNDCDTVVWGTSDSDNVVWGSSCHDSSCQ